MSAEILPFRAEIARSVPLAALPGALAVQAVRGHRGRRLYRLADMVRLCGLEDYEPRTAIDHLRLKARQEGLPLPRNTRVHRGHIITGPDAIGARSVWDALLVDEWLERPLPPAGGAGCPAANRPPLDAGRRLDIAMRAAIVAQRA